MKIHCLYSDRVFYCMRSGCIVLQDIYDLSFRRSGLFQHLKYFIRNVLPDRCCIEESARPLLQQRKIIIKMIGSLFPAVDTLMGGNEFPFIVDLNGLRIPFDAHLITGILYCIE